MTIPPATEQPEMIPSGLKKYLGDGNQQQSACEKQPVQLDYAHPVISGPAVYSGTACRYNPEYRRQPAD